MKLDISPLAKAFSNYRESITYLEGELSAQDDNIRKQFRNSVIQCFEYTYEVAYKMLKRQLAQIVENPGELKQMNFADLIRTAAEAGLVQDVQRFLEYRTLRNLTSHTYDEEKAELIVGSIEHFKQDIQYILTELLNRN